MVKGRIIKGYSGFYYVDTGKEVIACSLRGKYRIRNSDFLPGDLVEISITNLEKKVGVIEKTLKRKNTLNRPPVANVDQIIITNSLKDPKPDFMLTDRLIAVALSEGIEPFLIFNKSDLVSDDEREEIEKIYSASNLPLLFMTTMEEEKIPLYKKELEGILYGKMSILAGLSGVGKTSIINILDAGDDRAVGRISEKLKKGRHTTRHTELIQISENSWIADSPGFSSLDFPKDFKPDMLPALYRDYIQLSKDCKFKNCKHINEPDCQVKRSLEEGLLSQSRYENYKYLMEELIKREGSLYK